MNVLESSSDPQPARRPHRSAPVLVMPDGTRTAMQAGQKISISEPQAKAEICFALDTTGSMDDKLDSLVASMVDL